MSFRFTHSGSKRVGAMFKALADRAPKALREAGREINSRHAQAMRRRRIPRRTGRLEESLTRVGHPERVFISSAKLITVGTRVPYAQYHAHRITKLTRQERTFVFTEPIALVFHEALARGGV